MKFLPIYFCLLLSIIDHSNRPKADIIIIDIKDCGQFFDPTRKSIFTFGLTTSIATKGDVSLVIETQMASTTEYFLDSAGQQNHKILKEDSSYVYHVSQNGDRYGLSYHNHPVNKDSNNIFSVDSLLESLGLDEKNKLVLNIDLGSPSKVLKEKDMMLQKFLFVKKSPSAPDSVYRYNDKNFKDVQFSFSKSLDSKYGSKLVKTLIIFNPVSSVQGLDTNRIPRRVMETSMTRNTTHKIDHINEIFTKFSKDRHAHKLK
ncbi:MAG: hypothetical protein ACQUHE_12720 [Bacteroidia bacterium]